MTAPAVDRVVLPAGIGLRCVDACSGLPVVDGLQCSLRFLRQPSRIARATSTPSGVHHWPEFAARWALPVASPPSPPSPPLAEVRIDDHLGRYLPLRLAWPPEPDIDDTHLLTVTLMSAPPRAAPTGASTIHALLMLDDRQPAAWARVLATDEQGRGTLGMSDAGGRLTLHLPTPRPERRPQKSPPESPPSPGPGGALVMLQVCHDPAVGREAAAAAAPLLDDWLKQPEVRAVARIGTDDPFGPLRLQPDRPGVPVTAGLPPDRSELRLAPR